MIVVNKLKPAYLEGLGADAPWVCPAGQVWVQNASVFGGGRCEPGASLGPPIRESPQMVPSVIQPGGTPITAATVDPCSLPHYHYTGPAPVVVGAVVGYLAEGLLGALAGAVFGKVFFTYHAGHGA